MHPRIPIGPQPQRSNRRCAHVEESLHRLADVLTRPSAVRRSPPMRTPARFRRLTRRLCSSRVVRSICVEFLRASLPPTARLRTNRRDRVHDVGQRDHVGHVGRWCDGTQRHTVAFHNCVASDPEAHDPWGWGRVFVLPPKSPNTRRIDSGSRPVDRTGIVQFGQQQGVESGPHSGAMPLLEVASAATPGTPTRLARQIVPANAGPQNEENRR